MASAARAPAARTQQTVLPDEIWEDIFLRLDAAADLARASAACSTFRRIGDRHEFVPVDPPHRSAPEARALQQAADFTFSFLPKPVRWGFRYALDGRVLLGRLFSKKTRFEDFLVCDPLHRRYVEIPRIPEDLMASTPRSYTMHLLPVLAPAAENGEEESFRVICTVLFQGSVMAFVFSSCNQTWRGVSSTICLPNASTEYIPYYAHGCLYWMFYNKGYSLMFDTTSEMKFSIIDLPPHNYYSMRAIFEAEEGRLGFLAIADGTIVLYCNNPQSNGVGAQEWLHNKQIPLPKEFGIDCRWYIEGTAGHYLALVPHHGNSEHFLLDIKTLLLEKLCT